jgi:hypothetical protein
MQHVSYPLPPLMLTPIIEQCRRDHTHQHRESCDDDPEYCAVSQLNDASNVEPFIVNIEAGYGRHECDPSCPDRCMRSCDDSDWVVTLQYSSKGWQAVYGITKHGDVQDIAIWMD